MLEGIPKVMLSWARCLNLLHERCQAMQSSFPLLTPMATCATAAVLSHARRCEIASECF